MSRFTSLLNDLRRGGTTLDAVIESVDLELRQGITEPESLLEELAQAQSDSPLPGDMFTTLTRQIRSTQTSMRAGQTASDPDATRMVPKQGSGAGPISPLASSGPGQSFRTPRKAPKVGDVLNGRFILNDLIAQGRMSLVYRAIDQRKVEARARDPYLALKIMNGVESRQEAAFMALQREVQKCQALSHPNIVQVYDFDRDDETVFLTMEYLRGENLAKKMKTKIYPVSEALELIKQMGSALAYAHSQGVVHADFKPAKVMVTNSGALKVIDFGTARARRAAGDGNGDRERDDGEETVFDAGALTHAYASPEMLEGKEPEPRDDIYALGCVSFELIAGQHPWAGATAATARDAGLKLRRPDGLSNGVWRALTRTLEFERSSRTPTAQQFLDELEKPPRNAPKVGDVLNARFILNELIAQGGMSLVYRAIDQRKVEARARDPYLALKIMNVVESRQEEAFIALQREVQKCQALSHPNIVQVYDFDRDDETVFMTMEYLRGENLAKKMRTTTYPLSEALDLIKQMGSALAYAHNHGIVHADFKPGNVMVTNTGAVKVIDFGIARAHRAAGDADRDGDETVFDAGVLRALTLAYASPEMLEGKEPDPRDDIYALGCVSFELIAGQHPWAGAAATTARDTGKKLRKPDGLSNVIWRALTRALAFERSSRTPTAQQFLEELEKPPRPPVPWKMIGLSAGLAMLVASIAAWLYHDRDRTPPPKNELATDIRDCATCPHLLVIAANSATIGAAPGTGVFSFESPEHTVTLAAPFALAEHETTLDEFRVFADEVGFPAKACGSVETGWVPKNSLSWRNPGFPQNGDHPVTCVAWTDAVAYADWLTKKTGQTYRLPSEAEWEYAARSGASTATNAANENLCSQSNVADKSAQKVYPGIAVASCDDTFAYTAPATSGTPDALGLRGMRGNVFEWTLDCWNPTYEGAPSDGSAWQSGDCSKRVLRGGSWFTAPSEQRFTYRNRFDTDYRSNTFGFRVVREIK